MNHNYYWDMQKCICLLKDHVERQVQPFCHQNKITLLQVRILMALYFEGPQSAAALAHITHMAMTNLSPRCKQLESGGWLYRKRLMEDERQLEIGLTPAGQALVLDFLDQNRQALFTGLQSEDFCQVQAGLEQLLEMLRNAQQ